MSKQSNTEEFVSKSGRVHGDRYDYSAVKYVNCNTPVIIGCRIHGPFPQTPTNHLSGKGCPRCAGNVKRPAEEIMEEFSKIHGDRYEYDSTALTNSKQRIRAVCRIHGLFSVTYSKHRKGAGCPQCTGKYHHKAGQFFEQRARAIHGSKYTYGKYKGAAQKIEIVCPTHGPFYQLASGHLQGHGCSKCANDRKRQVAKVGYSGEFFVLHPEMRQHAGIFYIVEFNREGESFVKVGVTRTSVRSRFKSGYRRYKLRTILTKRLSLFAAFHLEQRLLDRFRPCRVFPKQDRFTGKTECLAPSCVPDLLRWLDSEMDRSSVVNINGSAMISDSKDFTRTHRRYWPKRSCR